MSNTEEISPELQILIESCKVSLLKKNPAQLERIVNSEVDWAKLQKMVFFHKISPVLHHSFKEINHQNSLSGRLQQISLHQAIANLSTSVELADILSQLQSQNIRILPYKGLIFLKEFYNNQPLREISDLDLVVHPEDAKKALMYFIQNGYVMHHRNPKKWESISHQLDDTLSAHGLHEITLDKTLENGFQVSIDFHWGFIYSFLPYQLDINVFFENTQSAKIAHATCQVPSDKILLMMLILHHGGRDCWVTFKLLTDLMMFYQSKSEDYNWQEAIDFASQLKLRKALLTGFCLLERYFDVDLNPVLKKNILAEKIPIQQLERIKKFWEKYQHFNSLFPRLRYERILISLQDKGFSVPKYYRNVVMMYGYPNPLENKRLVTFPSRFVYLNAAAKVFTYLLTKFKHNR
ncbi:MAG: nucleotidyltransferase family protein [Pseudarcicella sp.]|nr:nucleotidyltransferase family protein [Pseudarcicella sp.]